MSSISGNALKRILSTKELIKAMSKTPELYNVEVSWTSHGTFQIYAMSSEEAREKAEEKLNRGEMPEEEYIYEKSTFVEDIVDCVL